MDEEVSQRAPGAGAVIDERLAELIVETSELPTGNYPEDIRRQDDTVQALRRLQRLESALREAGEALEAGANAIDLHRMRAAANGHPSLHDGSTAERADCKSEDNAKYVGAYPCSCGLDAAIDAASQAGMAEQAEGKTPRPEDGSLGDGPGGRL